jgi:hypothetical protein
MHAKASGDCDGCDPLRLTAARLGTMTLQAVVVIVFEHLAPGDRVCTAIGAQRPTTVALAAPLADRAVLEVRQGAPVPVFPVSGAGRPAR